MESCPDCIEAKQLYKDNPEYELIDIGQQARSLKEFLALRDHHPAFEKVRERGNIGIPCFVREDGSVAISLKHYDAGHFTEGASEPQEGASCSLDGTGC
jgi:glutaredoxin-related protein